MVLLVVSSLKLSFLLRGDFSLRHCHRPGANEPLPILPFKGVLGLFLSQCWQEQGRKWRDRRERVRLVYHPANRAWIQDTSEFQGQIRRHSLLEVVQFFEALRREFARANCP